MTTPTRPSLWLMIALVVSPLCWVAGQRPGQLFTSPLVERVAAVADRAEAAERGQPVEGQDQVMADVTKAATQLAAYLETQPNDVRTLILSVRCVRRFRGRWGACFAHCRSSTCGVSIFADLRGTALVRLQWVAA